MVNYVGVNSLKNDHILYHVVFVLVNFMHFIYDKNKQRR
jgi:hypothetical protein